MDREPVNLNELLLELNLGVDTPDELDRREQARLALLSAETGLFQEAYNRAFESYTPGKFRSVPHVVAGVVMGLMDCYSGLKPVAKEFIESDMFRMALAEEGYDSIREAMMDKAENFAEEVFDSIEIAFSKQDAVVDALMARSEMTGCSPREILNNTYEAARVYRDAYDGIENYVDSVVRELKVAKNMIVLAKKSQSIPFALLGGVALRTNADDPENMVPWDSVDGILNFGEDYVKEAAGFAVNIFGQYANCLAEQTQDYREAISDMNDIAD